MVHTVLLTLATTAAVTLFLGLAVYVLTRNAKRPINWVFSLLCLAIANIYLSSLFMVVRPAPLPSLAHFFLHWKWIAVIFSATFFLHFVFFYFPISWQRYRFRILLTAYLVSAGIALIIASTDFLLLGHLHPEAPHIIAPTPGPLIYLVAGVFMLQVLGGTSGLIMSYQSATSPPLRREIFFLVIPTVFVLIGSIIHWIIVFAEGNDAIPHELPDTFLIAAAIIYVQAVIRHGVFVGRPLAGRNLFYTVLAIIMGLTIFYLSLSLDQWLMDYTDYPIPMATGILVLILAFGLPDIKRWFRRHLDPLLFKADIQQEELVFQLAKALAGSPDLEQLQVELLGSLCAALGVRDGYIAISTSETNPEELTVQAVQGNLPLLPGDVINNPPIHGNEAKLITAFLPPHTQTEMPWLNIALICPITFAPHQTGILAVGEKPTGQSFSPGEIALCNSLARQLDSIGQMIHLRAQRNHYLEAARMQQDALQQLEEKVVLSTRQTLTAWKNQEVPLAIHALGLLQVFKNGKLVSEADWGSEKAKALLAYLLWKSPSGATRAEISQVLWPDRPFEETANVFHVTLHRLRKVLQSQRSRKHNGDYIRCERKHYYFNTNLPHWLDVTAFQNYLESDSPSDWRAALELYRGSYLEDVAWSLPPEAEIQRRQLEQIYADTLRRLAARTNGQEAIAYLEKLLIVEPSDETVHEALVHGYLARGRRDLACQQVKRWQQTLVEFGYEATLETHLLWQKVEGNGQRN